MASHGGCEGRKASSGVTVSEVAANLSADDGAALAPELLTENSGLQIRALLTPKFRSGSDAPQVT